MNDTKMVISLDIPELKMPAECVLVGTAHVSRESINEVSNIIREEKPDLICVELDEGRYASITQKESWESLNMVKIFKEGKGFLLMANLVLSGFQRRMGAELGVKPGEEMKIALDTASELGIPYALCDREVQVTLRRAWARCGFWNKNKLLAALISSAFTTEKLSAQEIEDLKKRNELDGMMNELASYLPEVKETLIDERDQYLAAKIWSSSRDMLSAGKSIPAAPDPAQSDPAAPDPAQSDPAQSDPAQSDPAQSDPAQPNPTAPPASKRIVAVVGAGHMQGIKNHLEKIAAGEKKAETGDLNIIPPKNIVSKTIPFLFPVAIIGLIAFGFFRHGADMSFYMLVRWVMWNGSLAALGCILALGHPLSVVIAFIAAPITTVTPFIGVGMFSGVVQVILRKPRVADAQNLIDDVGGLKSFYRNRITHALLVFFLTQLGGVAGTFVSVPALAAGLWVR